MFTVSRESSGSSARTVFSFPPVTVIPLTRTFMFRVSIAVAFFSAALRTSISECAMARAALSRSLSAAAQDDP